MGVYQGGQSRGKRMGADTVDYEGALRLEVEHISGNAKLLLALLFGFALAAS